LLRWPFIDSFWFFAISAFSSNLWVTCMCLQVYPLGMYCCM
jgi:hypothetical protein